MRVLWVVAWRRGDVEGPRAQAEIGAAIEERLDLDATATFGRYWLAVLAVIESDHDTAWTPVDEMLARCNLPPIEQALQIPRSMLLRRSGRVVQAWEELTRSQPVGSALLARADAIRREAPVLLNLHGVEVDGVRRTPPARERARSTTDR
jgi:hypothetical protein